MLQILEYQIEYVDPGHIKEMFEQNRDYVTGRLFGIYYRDLPGSHTVSDEFLAELADQYKEFYMMPISSNYKRLGIDLFITDRPNEGFSIYQVIPQ